MSKGCPSGHKQPDKTCKWCLMAINKDRRYYRSWFGQDQSRSVVRTITPGTKTVERCIHLGIDTKELIECKTCTGNVQLKIFECAIYGQCTLTKPAGNLSCCAGRPVGGSIKPCPSFTTSITRRTVNWAYGVTTVPQRRRDLLPKTLESLSKAGFAKPHLFIDNDRDGTSWSNQFNLPVTCRSNNVRTYGNWFLAMSELFILYPNADLYALFQDDLIAYVNLRQYLERCDYPEYGYWNLYTFPSNYSIAPKDNSGKPLEGWYLSNQFGRGAVGLVFNRKALLTLLSHPHMTERPLDPNRGHRAVDGGIVTALNKAGWKEYVHNPSLLQHTGHISSMGNKPHLQANSFRGENYDALELVK